MIRSVVVFVLACTTPPELGATERCNGKDDDGNGIIDDTFDQDGDGFPSCVVFGGFEEDCDDADPRIHPGMGEVCDGRDSDCDGVVPDWEVDHDGDGIPSCAGDCDDALMEANPHDADGDGFSTCMGDCDDFDPTRHPAAPERCNGVDDDCSGFPDEDELDLDGDSDLACAGDCDDLEPGLNTLDVDGDGYGTCGAAPDCDDLDPWVFPDATEVCDGRDNDCDGVVDDACL